MKSNLYSSIDYKELIKAEIHANQGQRGYQSLLAKAADCQTSFFSQVLNGHTHLTPDQASGITEFWELDSLATEYFLTSVNLGRASKKHYQKFLQNKLEKLRDENETITRRVKAGEIDSDFEANYYSVWFRGAIHMILTIPEFQDVDSIAKRLNLSHTLVQNEVLNLQKMGLAESKDNNQWNITKKQIHLNPKSSLSEVNLSNWRQIASTRVFTKDPQSLHFSGVYSLSKKDYQKIKNILLEILSDIKQIIEPSREEEIAYFGIDYFKL